MQQGIGEMNKAHRAHVLGIMAEITMLAILLLSDSVGTAPAEQWNTTFGGIILE